MGYKFDEDGLKIEQPCADPNQRNWADYLDSRAQDVREGKVSIVSVQHDLNNKFVRFNYNGITTK